MAVSDVVKVGVALIALWWFARIVGQVDRGAVWVTVRDLTPLEIVALLAMVAVRQTLNAGPLAIFVPSLPLRRALANDLSANLIATVAPPPADVVLRISMLRSWGINAAEGVSGISLNTLTYYVARFGAPVLGLARPRHRGPGRAGRCGGGRPGGGAGAADLAPRRPGRRPARSDWC